MPAVFDDNSCFRSSMRVLKASGFSDTPLDTRKLDPQIQSFLHNLPAEMQSQFRSFFNLSQSLSLNETDSASNTAIKLLSKLKGSSLLQTEFINICLARIKVSKKENDFIGPPTFQVLVFFAKALNCIPQSSSARDELIGILKKGQLTLTIRQETATIQLFPDHTRFYLSYLPEESRLKIASALPFLESRLVSDLETDFSENFKQILAEKGSSQRPVADRLIGAEIELVQFFTKELALADSVKTNRYLSVLLDKLFNTFATSENPTPAIDALLDAIKAMPHESAGSIIHLLLRRLNGMTPDASNPTTQRALSYLATTLDGFLKSEDEQRVFMRTVRPLSLAEVLMQKVARLDIANPGDFFQRLQAVFLPPNSIPASQKRALLQAVAQKFRDFQWPVDPAQQARVAIAIQTAMNGFYAAIQGVAPALKDPCLAAMAACFASAPVQSETGNIALSADSGLADALRTHLDPDIASEPPIPGAPVDEAGGTPVRFFRHTRRRPPAPMTPPPPPPPHDGDDDDEHGRAPFPPPGGPDERPLPHPPFSPHGGPSGGDDDGQDGPPSLRGLGLSSHGALLRPVGVPPPPPPPLVLSPYGPRFPGLNLGLRLPSPPPPVPPPPGEVPPSPGAPLPHAGPLPPDGVSPPPVAGEVLPLPVPPAPMTPPPVPPSPIEIASANLLKINSAPKLLEMLQTYHRRFSESHSIPLLIELCEFLDNRPDFGEAIDDRIYDQIGAENEVLNDLIYDFIEALPTENWSMHCRQVMFSSALPAETLDYLQRTLPGKYRVTDNHFLQIKPYFVTALKENKLTTEDIQWTQDPVDSQLHMNQLILASTAHLRPSDLPSFLADCQGVLCLAIATTMPDALQTSLLTNIKTILTRLFIDSAASVNAPEMPQILAGLITILGHLADIDVDGHPIQIKTDLVNILIQILNRLPKQPTGNPGIERIQLPTETVRLLSRFVPQVGRADHFIFTMEMEDVENDDEDVPLFLDRKTSEAQIGELIREISSPAADPARLFARAAGFLLITPPPSSRLVPAVPVTVAQYTRPQIVLFDFVLANMIDQPAIFAVLFNNPESRAQLFAMAAVYYGSLLHPVEGAPDEEGAARLIQTLAGAIAALMESESVDRPAAHTNPSNPAFYYPFELGSVFPGSQDNFQRFLDQLTRVLPGVSVAHRLAFTEHGEIYPLLDVPVQFCRLAFFRTVNAQLDEYHAELGQLAELLANSPHFRSEPRDLQVEVAKLSESISQILGRPSSIQEERELQIIVSDTMRKIELNISRLKVAFEAEKEDIRTQYTRIISQEAFNPENLFSILAQMGVLPSEERTQLFLNLFGVYDFETRLQFITEFQRYYQEHATDLLAVIYKEFSEALGVRIIDGDDTASVSTTATSLSSDSGSSSSSSSNSRRRSSASTAAFFMPSGTSRPRSGEDVVDDDLDDAESLLPPPLPGYQQYLVDHPVTASLRPLPRSEGEDFMTRFRELEARVDGRRLPPPARTPSEQFLAAATTLSDRAFILADSIDSKCREHRSDPYSTINSEKEKLVLILREIKGQLRNISGQTEELITETLQRLTDIVSTLERYLSILDRLPTARAGRVLLPPPSPSLPTEQFPAQPGLDLSALSLREFGTSVDDDDDDDFEDQEDASSRLSDDPTARDTEARVEKLMADHPELLTQLHQRVPHLKDPLMVSPLDRGHIRHVRDPQFESLMQDVERLERKGDELGALLDTANAHPSAPSLLSRQASVSVKPGGLLEKLRQLKQSKQQFAQYVAQQISLRLPPPSPLPLDADEDADEDAEERYMEAMQAQLDQYSHLAMDISRAYQALPPGTLLSDETAGQLIAFINQYPSEPDGLVGVEFSQELIRALSQDPTFQRLFEVRSSRMGIAPAPDGSDAGAAPSEQLFIYRKNSASSHSSPREAQPEALLASAPTPAVAALLAAGASSRGIVLPSLPSPALSIPNCPTLSRYFPDGQILGSGLPSDQYPAETQMFAQKDFDGYVAYGPINQLLEYMEGHAEEEVALIEEMKRLQPALQQNLIAGLKVAGSKHGGTDRGPLCQRLAGLGVVKAQPELPIIRRRRAVPPPPAAVPLPPPVSEKKKIDLAESAAELSVAASQGPQAFNRVVQRILSSLEETDDVDTRQQVLETIVTTYKSQFENEDIPCWYNDSDDDDEDEDGETTPLPNQTKIIDEGIFSGKDGAPIQLLRIPVRIPPALRPLFISVVESVFGSNPNYDLETLLPEKKAEACCYLPLTQKKPEESQSLVLAEEPLPVMDADLTVFWSGFTPETCAQKVNEFLNRPDITESTWSGYAQRLIDSLSKYAQTLNFSLSDTDAFTIHILRAVIYWHHQRFGQSEEFNLRLGLTLAKKFDIPPINIGVGSQNYARPIHYTVQLKDSAIPVEILLYDFTPRKPVLALPSEQAIRSAEKKRALMQRNREDLIAEIAAEKQRFLSVSSDFVASPELSSAAQGSDVFNEALMALDEDAPSENDFLKVAFLCRGDSIDHIVKHFFEDHWKSGRNLALKNMAGRNPKLGAFYKLLKSYYKLKLYDQLKQAEADTPVSTVPVVPQVPQTPPTFQSQALVPEVSPINLSRLLNIDGLDLSPDQRGEVRALALSLLGTTEDQLVQTVILDSETGQKLQSALQFLHPFLSLIVKKYPSALISLRSSSILSDILKYPASTISIHDFRLPVDESAQRQLSDFIAHMVSPDLAAIDLQELQKSFYLWFTQSNLPTKMIIIMELLKNLTPALVLNRPAIHGSPDAENWFGVIESMLTSGQEQSRPSAVGEVFRRGGKLEPVMLVQRRLAPQDPVSVSEPVFVRSPLDSSIRTELDSSESKPHCDAVMQDLLRQVHAEQPELSDLRSVTLRDPIPGDDQGVYRSLFDNFHASQPDTANPRFFFEITETDPPCIKVTQLCSSESFKAKIADLDFSQTDQILELIQNSQRIMKSYPESDEIRQFYISVLTLFLQKASECPVNQPVTFNKWVEAILKDSNHSELPSEVKEMLLKQIIEIYHAKFAPASHHWETGSLVDQSAVAITSVSIEVDSDEADQPSKTTQVSMLRVPFAMPDGFQRSFISTINDLLNPADYPRETFIPEIKEGEAPYFYIPFPPLPA